MALCTHGVMQPWRYAAMALCSQDGMQPGWTPFGFRRPPTLLPDDLVETSNQASLVDASAVSYHEHPNRERHAVSVML